MDARTLALLEAPIASTLLRLAMPNVLIMLAQAAAGLVETYFIGKLGTDALAGVALVFPLVMLMQMMSAGAMGGGIASSIARALGAGRRADANALRCTRSSSRSAWARPSPSVWWAAGGGSIRRWAEAVARSRPR
jgi:Na+-driven multidrug efflux pump